MTGDAVAATERRDSLLAVLTVVGSPLAAGTALLFYFGWVRTHVQARALGFDAALLNLTVQDYMMRSIDVLYNPVLVLVLAATALQWLHRRHVLSLIRGPRGPIWLPRLIRACGWAAVAWLVVFAGLALAVPGLVGIAVAGFLTATLLSALYGRSLRAHLERPPSHPPVSRALLLALLALSVFWATEQLARKVGQAYAAQITADRTRLVAVTVYSTKSLGLDRRGAVETRLNDPDGAFPFRYDGLRMLQRSGDRYFLIGADWTADNRRVVLLQESDHIRLEFGQVDR